MEQLIKYFLATGCGAIIGYLIRVLVEHRLAIERLKENVRIVARDRAVENFRRAFGPTLAYIYLSKRHGTNDQRPTADVDKFLRKSLLRHGAAIEGFRPFVPKDQAATYQEAWEKYRYEVWNYGFEAESFRTDIHDPWKVFEDLIHVILQFAYDV